MPWLERIREESRTTPGKLTAIAIGAVVGVLVFALVASSVVGARRRAADEVAHQTEPLLSDAAGLYVSLTDADATATATFLTGGLEPVSRRTRYVADLRAASRDLAALTAAAAGSRAASAAATEITVDLPVYSGLVETARADNRAGLPVGAAYLREASKLLQSPILPAADRIYAIEAGRLDAGYASGTRIVGLLLFVAVALVSVTALVLVQRYLLSATRRIVNTLVAAGTALLAALSLWVLIALVSQQSSLARAQRDGSDPVEILSATRILASRAESDQSLTLAARGGDAQHPADFKAVMVALTGRSGSAGLLGQGATVERRSGSTGSAARLLADVAAYKAHATTIDGLVRQGEIPQAIAAEAAAVTRGTGPAEQLSADLQAQIASAQRRFVSAAGDATSALSGLGVAVPLFGVAIAALAVAGVSRRLREYI